MNEVAKDDNLEGTEARRFLARRGAVAVKETRDIGVVSGLYSDELLISTMVIAIVKGPRREMSYSVKVERRDEDKRTTTSVLLDFDEIPELLDAFDFISSNASDMKGEKRDYTEVTYSTKDAAQFGFFQNSENQQLFVSLQPHGDTTFLANYDFSRLKASIAQAKSHLESRGASLV